MIIGIPLSRCSYTPEAYAYENYLKKLGHQVQLDYDLDPNNDINIFFMGTRPFWKKVEGRAIEIHEYHSISTPPYAKLRNFSKRIINKKPAGRIFLNEFVHHELNFSDDIPFIYRDMGVEEALFQSPSKNPLYDIVYCGSISGRSGLIETLLILSKDYKIAVVGRVTEQEQILLRVKNITLLGQVGRDQLPEIYRNARYGLNYTPDSYPFNLQTSTKTLEYLASGLGVISNNYQWATTFFKKNQYKPIWLNSISESTLHDHKFPMINYDNFRWSKVLQECGLESFLYECKN